MPQRVVDQLPHLGEGLHAGVPGTHEDERQVSSGVAGVGLGGVEPADHVVAQADGVADVLERERVLGEPGIGRMRAVEPRAITSRS